MDETYLQDYRDEDDYKEVQLDPWQTCKKEIIICKEELLLFYKKWILFVT